MKKNFFLLIMSLFAFSLIHLIPAIAANMNTECNHDDILCLIEKTQSKNLEDRIQAAYLLGSISPIQQTQAVKDALIDLLERESNKIQLNGGYKSEKPPMEGEDEGEYKYFHDLCFIVGKTTDPKAIPILVRIGYLDALEPFGEAVLDLIITKIEDKSWNQRLVAFKVLNDFLTPKEKGYTAEGEARQKIRIALLKAAKNEDELVREGAAHALGNFQDDEVITVLEDLKNNDHFYRVGKKDIKYYTVREGATEALEKIKKAKEQ